MVLGPVLSCPHFEAAPMDDKHIILSLLQVCERAALWLLDAKRQVPPHVYTVSKDGTVSGPNHSPTFRADDSSMPVGMRAMANVLMDYLLKRAEGDKP